MVFGDVSGFTKMSERLARHGKVGAEEVTDAINTCFEALLNVAYEADGSLLKFGGDALLLYFDGPGHASRAAWAAMGMRSTLRQVGRIATTAGLVTLRISIGVHTGTFHTFLVGGSHREFLITGPGASATVGAESSASAGEIVMSAAAAAMLPSSCRGPARGNGYLLRGRPHTDVHQPAPAMDGNGVDIPMLVPVAIRNHLMGGDSEPEHRRAAVAFVHFEGTDEMIDHLGPEEVTGRLDRLVRSVQRACDDLKVTLLGTDIDGDGGKIILVSGVPRRLGEDEDRLVSALRRIIDSDPPVPVRIGVHSGPVFAADVGPRYRRTFTIMGDTVNMAARVMSRAEPGHVLATPDVLERCRRTYTTTALEPFMVKGKRAPVTAFDVGPARQGTASAARLLPQAGRQVEMEQLRSELHAIASKGARVVEVVAGPGMGKSRLVDEFRALAPQLPAITIACEEYDRDTPYGPFRLLGLHVLGLDDEIRSAVIAEQLHELVHSTTPELTALIPLIGAALGLELPDTPETMGLEAEFRRSQVHESTASFLARALPEPCILVFEDVHHMDEPSRDLLQALVEAQKDRSILVIMTRRDGPTQSILPAETAVRTIGLGPLSDEAAVEALISATEDAPLLPHELRALVDRAAGSPLFLESLLQSRREGAALDDLPATVDAIVTTNIDSLPTRHRQLLRSASVLGLVFTLRELSDILDPGDDPLDPETFKGLDEFVVMDSADVLRFRLTVMRDCAYETLPFRRRRDLHGRAARSIMARYGDDSETKAALLSMHFFHAGAFTQAWRFACIAGQRASDNYANVEAASLFERALASARRVRTLAPTDVAEAWESLGDARERVGSTTARRVPIELLAGSPVAFPSKRHGCC